MHAIDLTQTVFLPTDTLVVLSDKDVMVLADTTDCWLEPKAFLQRHAVLNTPPLSAYAFKTPTGHLYGVSIPHSDPSAVPEGYTWLSLRAVLSAISSNEAHRLCRAKHLLHWQGASRYCGYCGTALLQDAVMVMKKCPQCQHEVYPTFSPAVLVSVEREDEILLARSAHFTPGVYSVLAGFIEPGESAEAAAQREVFEETGVMISPPQYVASQPWPFPQNFMMGFRADYVSGDLVIQYEELEDAQWFHVSNLPPLPHHASISRQLIEAFIARVR